MPPQPIPASSLQSTYAQLRDDLSVAAVPVTDRFWSDLAGGRRPELDEGRLVLLLHHTQSWTTWEMHPAGDELVILQGGEADLRLELDGGEVSVALRKPGDFVRVPRGVWHTARIDRPTALLFITPGRGTQTRPA